MPVRILIVEDDAAMRYAISRALENDAFAVEVAVDGEARILAARSRDYDVVLLDWMRDRLRAHHIALAVATRIRWTRSSSCPLGYHVSSIFSSSMSTYSVT